MSDDSSIDSTVESSSSPATVRASLDDFYQTATYQVLHSQSTGSLDGVFHTRREVRQEPRGVPTASTPGTDTQSRREFHVKAADIDHTASVTNTMAAYLREVDKRTQDLIRVEADPRTLLYKSIMTMHDRLYTFLVNPNTLPHESNRVQEVLKKYNVSALQVPRSQDVSDLIMDTTMEDAIKDISQLLARPAGEPEFMTLICKYKSLMDLYKTYGDELLHADSALTDVTKQLEGLQERSNFIMSLRENEALEPLYKSYMSYIETEAVNLSLEEKYQAVVAAYKRWNLTRILLKSIRNSVVVTEAAADSERPAPTCAICITNEVSYVSIPCGHTLCPTCIGRMTHVCYICRTPIKQKLRLYF